MSKVKVQNSSGTTRRMRPALTPEARENQMISLAMDVVEQRLLDGTASSQETVHFLKLGTTLAKLEKEKLIHENEMLQAKTQSLRSAARVEELYEEAIKAMRRYSGNGETDED